MGFRWLGHKGGSAQVHWCAHHAIACPWYCMWGSRAQRLSCWDVFVWFGLPLIFFTLHFWNSNINCVLLYTDDVGNIFILWGVQKRLVFVYLETQLGFWEMLEGVALWDGHESKTRGFAMVWIWNAPHSLKFECLVVLFWKAVGPLCDEA